MEIKEGIFRQYDIRGIADKELGSDVVRAIGRAYATVARGEGLSKIAVGRDVRLSSPRIQSALIEGLTAGGCDVLDIGEVPTPLLYYAVFSMDLDGGIMVTGSHNPVEYNGLKMMKGKQALFGDAIKELYRMAISENWTSGSGSVERVEIVPRYAEEVLSKVKLAKPLYVIVDPGNGTAGPVAVPLLERLGCRVECIFCEPDGRFPHHLPDPTVPEYMESLCRIVVERGADLGIGYDGDADRVGIVDEKGNMVYGDKLLALLAGDLLSRHPGAKVIFDVKCSQGVVEYIEQKGGVPVMWKTGHSLIKAKMKEEGALLAGEMSGHLFVGENYYGFDDAIFASLRLVGVFAQEGRPVSSVVSDVPDYCSTPEIRVQSTDEDKFRIVKEVGDFFRGQYPVIDIDGVRILFEGGWGLVRASNTQPVLVLRFEARSKDRLEEIKKEVMTKLRELGVG